MKSLKLLHKKKTIYLTKGQIILTNVDIKTNSPFHGMTTRTKSYVFTEIFLAVFPLESTFWPGLLMFCIIWFSKQKSSSSKRRFRWRTLWGIFLVKTKWKSRHHFVWILLHCNFFFMRYIFWLKITVRHETLSIKTYQNSFLTYFIILLFPPIYVVIEVIEHSFMN